MVVNMGGVPVARTTPRGCQERINFPAISTILFQDLFFDWLGLKTKR